MNLITPNAINVEVHSAPGPSAHPASVVLQGPGGMKVYVFGGISKLELLAGTILSGLHESRDPNAVQRAVDGAEAILAECARRDRTRQEQA